MPDFKVAWRKSVYALPIPSQHRLVLLALGEYADWTTHRGAHPGTKRLSADTASSESTVQRALASGVELGVLAQTARGHNTSKGRSVANSYDLRLQSQPVSSDLLARGAEPTGQSEQANRSIRESQPVSSDHLTTPISTPSSTSKLKDSKPEGSSLSSGPRHFELCPRGCGQTLYVPETQTRIRDHLWRYHPDILAPGSFSLPGVEL